MSDIHIYLEREQPVKVITLEPTGARGPVGPQGPAGAAGPNSVTSATTSDGTANLSVAAITGNGSGLTGLKVTRTFADQIAVNAATPDFIGQLAMKIDTGNLLQAIGTSAGEWSGNFTFNDIDTGSILADGDITANNVTVNDILYADHIHGNLAGSVYAHVRAGEALAKGDPVYISGSHGTAPNLIPIVSKADASNSAKMPAIGIMDAALANNASGHMVITGTIADLNTAAYSVNDTLYVASGGGLTATPPVASSQPVARVERSNANNGALIVKVNGLASNGGNGVSDTNKLARFSSTGGISQTGGTMTDTTYAGTASFTSTTRPTSAGTGTPAATSLITRADGDARFLLKPFIGILSTAVNSDTNTTTYKTVTELQTTLAAGTYLLECQLIHDGNANYATSGVKDRINVVSGSATAVGFLYRIFDNATTTTTFPSGRVSTNPLVESAPTNRSQSTLRTGILTVTSTAVIAVQIAQTAAVAASNTTLQVGSYLKITPIS